jgi:hypothetical protein
MAQHSPDHGRRSLDSLYRADAGRILATLVRLLGEPERPAEEAARTGINILETAVEFLLP